MKTYNVAQGTAEWKALRAGCPTASKLDKIVQPSSGKLSKSFPKYMAFLLAEWYLGEPIEQYVSPHMERGTDLEAEARAWYSFDSGYDVEQVGFCLTDDGRFGCSPDGLIGNDLGLELKCPSLETHMAYLLDDGLSLVADYECQIQASMMVTGRKRWEVASFSPVLPSIRVEVQPEPEFQEAAWKAIEQFAERMDAAKRKLAPMKADRDAALAAKLEAAMASDESPF